MRWRQFGYLIRLFIALKRLPETERNAALSSPDTFVGMSESVEDQGAATQRHALDHLLFPDDFPPVVSQEQRSKILAHWAEVGTTDEPEAIRLRHVVRQLGPDPAAFVNFYRSPWFWQWSEPTPQWQLFGKWATHLTRLVKLEEEERDYKVAAYDRLREAGEALDAGASEWTKLLGTAVTRENNLIGWRVHQPFLAWVTSEPQAAEAALRELWRDPGWSSIDRFLALVPSGAAQGTAARLSVASFLLGTANPAAFPPWRARATDTAYRLTSFAKPEPTATDGERYQTFLDFLDLVRDICARNDVALQDRLDAQGLMWALINHDPSSNWSARAPRGLRCLAQWQGSRTA